MMSTSWYYQLHNLLQSAKLGSVMSNSKFSNAILGRSVDEQQNVYCDASIILENRRQKQKISPS